jgi:hypothetical protein
MVHWDPAFNEDNCSQGIGMDTPIPALARAENAAAVVWPCPVAQVVNKDFADAIRSSRLRNESLRDYLRHVLNDGLREPFDRLKSSFGASGTTTCRPLPPDVFSQLSNSNSVNIARVSTAAS